MTVSENERASLRMEIEGASVFSPGCRSSVAMFWVGKVILNGSHDSGLFRLSLLKGTVCARGSGDVSEYSEGGHL